MNYVIKIGGGKNVAVNNILSDVANIVAKNKRVVIVHGASHEIHCLGQRLGIRDKKITSPSGMVSRYTDPEVLEVALMAFDRVNRSIVSKLFELGVCAAGFAAMDGKTTLGKRKKAIRSVVDNRVSIIRNEYSASIKKVDTNLIETILNKGITPVISPPAWDAEDGPVNVDADRLAAAIGAGLAPSRLCLMTNVDGLFRDFNNPSSLIKTVDRCEIDNAMACADGRMKMKVLAAKEALEGGVHDVVISSGACDIPIKSALNGSGTVFI